MQNVLFKNVKDFNKCYNFNIILATKSRLLLNLCKLKAYHEAKQASPAEITERL